MNPQHNQQMNNRFRHDLKIYLMVCVLGEVCALILMNFAYLLPAYYCALMPACMIVIYLMTTPPCNREGAAVLNRLTLTAITALIIGLSICLFTGQKHLSTPITFTRFLGFIGISLVLNIVGTKIGIFPLPPRRNN